MVALAEREGFGEYRLSPTQIQERALRAREELQQKRRPNEFSKLLRLYRERCGKSRSGLARQAGVDASYINRCEAGDRNPPLRDVVIALSKVLNLTEYERNHLLVAAGHLPPILDGAEKWTPAFQAIVNVYSNIELTAEEQEEFTSGIVSLLANKWAHAARQEG